MPQNRAEAEVSLRKRSSEEFGWGSVQLPLVNIWSLASAHAAGEDGQLDFFTRAYWRGQTGQWQMCRCIERGTWLLKKHLTPKYSPCHPKARVAYASSPIHTPVSLENEHIVLCRGGQFAEFNFTPSICLMNNNKLEGFTGFQQWAEIFINNRFSDLTWIWFCLDHLPLARPCTAQFYVAKLNQSLHIHLKGRKK